MSDSSGSPPRGAGASASEATAEFRRPDLDQRSQQLLQGGAASRSWADATARESVQLTKPERASNGGSGAASYQAPGPAQPPAGSPIPPGAPGAPAAAPTAAAGASSVRPARRARLRVAHVGPMSVLRLTALFGLCMMVVLLVAVAALWLVLNAAGVFDSLSKTIATVNDSSESSAGHWFSFSRVMAITAIVGLIQVVVFSLLSSVVALLYNLCSDFVGGVEVTLSEK